MRQHRTEFRLYVTIQGTFYWPIDEPWERDTELNFTRVSESVHRQSEASDLREAALRLLDSGDSATAEKIAYGTLEVTQLYQTHSRSRSFDLDRFGSLLDLLA
jgi:acetaldehyde dehydrogenase (acetylating)